MQKVTRCGSNERQEWMPQMDPVCVSLRCAVPCHSDSHLQKDTFVEDCDYASKMNYFKQRVFGELEYKLLFILRYVGFFSPR